MWLHQVNVDKNVHKYISPKLCLTPEIKSKYFRIGECVGIGQTTVPELLWHIWHELTINNESILAKTALYRKTAFNIDARFFTWRYQPFFIDKKCKQNFGCDPLNDKVLTYQTKTKNIP